MSQGQPRRTRSEEAQTEAIKYGDVFTVSGDLSGEPIAPLDASMMQAAENIVLGHTQKGGPAAVMQSAAARNERAGLVGHKTVTDVAGEEGVTLEETNLSGQRVITESVAGQVVGQYVELEPIHMTSPPPPPPPPALDKDATTIGQGPEPIHMMTSPPPSGQDRDATTIGQGPEPIHMTSPSSALDRDAITIGQALEATAVTAGDKPIDQSDAAAIKAAEMRATGLNVITPGGIGAVAQTAATMNERTTYDTDKLTLADVLTDATKKMPGDKAATREDAEGVVGAELRNNPRMATYPGGVSASVAAAARLNQERV